MTPETTTITVRDVRIRTHRAGLGRPQDAPVLFLHGASGVGAWLPFFETLAAERALLVPEHPGFGGSDDPSWIRHVPDLAMFYLDFLEAAGLAGVHLIGHSLGGWIAAELAIRDCARLRSLTLLAPAGLLVKGVPMGDNFIWSPEEQFRNVVFDQDLAERMLSLPVSEEQADTMLKNRFAATKYGWRPRWFDPDLEKWLHRVKVPVHILWGADDRLLPSAYAEAWRRGLPASRLTLVERCGHLPHIERADEVARRVGKFLGGVAA